MIRTQGAGRARGHTNGQACPLRDGEWLLVQRRLKVSPQQLQIMRAIIEQDQTAKEIARGLGISTHTVNTQLERLFTKLQVRSRVGLTRRVFEEVLRMRGEQPS